MKKEEKKKLPISFYSKEVKICPICGEKFYKEEMLSGGGRMIAGSLTDELHREFEPSAKYGKVYPLIYSIAACPKCHFASLWRDFDSFNKEHIGDLYISRKERMEAVSTIFPHYNLTQNRTLLDGAAAYYLALLSYEKMPSVYSPTIKKAQIALRLAWLCDDLDKECPNHNYDYIKQVFYQKALFFYQLSLQYELEHVEDIANISSFGPDIDKNYGYDGVIYLCGLLEYKYGQKEDYQARLKKLDEYKRAIARGFGLGKSSKAKPGPLLEHSRALYDNINAEIKNASIIDSED